jgi:hypothetical protein
MVSINQDVDGIDEVKAQADSLVSDKYFACKSAEDCIRRSRRQDRSNS